jgi:hypothetical protein
MYHNIKAFQVKLHLWEHQLKLHNLVHFLHLKSLESICPELLQQYPKPILLLQEEVEERFQDFKIMEP